MKRKKDEPQENYRMRTEQYFINQQSFEVFHQLLDTHFERFIQNLEGKIKQKLGVNDIKVKKETRLVSRDKIGNLDKNSDYGGCGGD